MKQIKDFATYFFDIDICQTNIAQEWMLFINTFTSYAHWLQFAEFGRIAELPNQLHPAIRARVIQVLTFPSACFHYSVPNFLAPQYNHYPHLEYKSQYSFWSSDNSFLLDNENRRFLPLILAAYQYLLQDELLNKHPELVAAICESYLNFAAAAVTQQSFSPEIVKLFTQVILLQAKASDHEFSALIKKIITVGDYVNPFLEPLLVIFETALRMHYVESKISISREKIITYLKFNAIELFSKNYAPNRTFVIDTKLDSLVVSIIDEMGLPAQDMRIHFGAIEQIIPIALVMYEGGQFEELNRLYSYFVTDICESRNKSEFFKFILSDELLDGRLVFENQAIQKLSEKRIKRLFPEVQHSFERHTEFGNYFKRFK
jgi:hypothetical protein